MIDDTMRNDARVTKPNGWWKFLRKYQREAALWMSQPPPGYRGRLLADPMGYGKSLSLLGAVRNRRDEGQEDRCTPIICTSNARGDWRRHIKMFWPEARVHTVVVDDVKHQRKGESDEQFSKRALDKWLPTLRSETDAPHNFCIVNYESVGRLMQEAAKQNVLFDCAIFDEAHAMKKMSTERAKLSRPLLARSNIGLLATGTPVHNRPHDLYNLLDMCMPSYAGSFSRWAEKYFIVRVSEKGYGRTVDELFDKPGLKESLTKVMLQRSVAEAYGELPPVQRVVKRVDAPETYRISPAKAMKMSDEGVIGKALRDCVKAKLNYAVELVEEIGEPVVLFTYQGKDAVELHKKLQAAGIGSLLAIGSGHEGGSTAAKRDKILEEWKSAGRGQPHALVCTMDAVKESATLTRADKMIFVDIDWLPGKQAQCEGRIAPSRQPENERRPVIYYYLVVEGGTDEVVAERCVEKLKEADGLPGSSDDQRMYTQMLKTVAGKAAKEETPEQTLKDLISRISIRADRLSSIGLYSDDD